MKGNGLLLLGFCALLGLGAWLLATKPPTEELRSATAHEGPDDPSTPPDVGCAMALAPHHGTAHIDREIIQLQEQARSHPGRTETMIRLGWAFITEARLSYDPGYYKLAEQCAFCAQAKGRDNPDALLLAGHIWQSLHRFKEAEPIARQLVNLRSQAFDYSLLGDVLMEQGRLNEAVIAYQKMIDLRPDLESYTRVAHIRWLKGDLDGAIEVMRMAVTSGSPRDAEPTAWAFTRLGLYELQAGELANAQAAAGAASQFAENYAAALLLRARVLLAEDQAAAAIGPLEQAASLARLPEYQWMLADALREAGKTDAAKDVEQRLVRDGARNDPRTFALYLVTRGEQPQRALQLAEEELTTREDIFTMDALAWALQANGRTEDARKYSRKALREGTRDARLYYHAGRIALSAGDSAGAEKWFALAYSIRQTLMPSEKEDLEKAISGCQRPDHSRSIVISN